MFQTGWGGRRDILKKFNRASWLSLFHPFLIFFIFSTFLLLRFHSFGNLSSNKVTGQMETEQQGHENMADSDGFREGTSFGTHYVFLLITPFLTAYCCRFSILLFLFHSCQIVDRVIA